MLAALARILLLLARLLAAAALLLARLARPWGALLLLVRFLIWDSDWDFGSTFTLLLEG
jgi:hypothetical protein